MMNYAQQIKHPKWQKKRLEVLKLHKFTCQVCGEKEEELHVHHPVYKRGAMIWEYDKGELECLCHRCHKDAHAIDEQIKKALASCKDKEKVLTFILDMSKTGSKVQKNPSTHPAFDLEIVKPQLNEEDAKELEEYYNEDSDFYTKYPHYRPRPDDTCEQRSEKFLAKMKHLMG